MYIFFYIIYFYLGANIQKGQDPDPLSVLGVPSAMAKKMTMLIILNLASVTENFSASFV